MPQTNCLCDDYLIIWKNVNFSEKNPLLKWIKLDSSVLPFQIDFNF